jgi:uncharacterized protein YbcI
MSRFRDFNLENLGEEELHILKDMLEDKVTVESGNNVGPSYSFIFVEDEHYLLLKKVRLKIYEIESTYKFYEE